MRKTVHKLFWAWNFDKEEKWLNEMASKGLTLVSTGYCKYEFENTLPGEYGIRLEMLENSVNNPESEKYLEFLESTGVEHIGTWFKWVYLRKKKTDGDFELFSDNESRIKHLSRIMRLCMILGVLNIVVGMYNVLLYFFIETGVSLFGLINLVLGIMCMLGYYRLYKKRNTLKNELQIFE